jgi:hypothetical protein
MEPLSSPHSWALCAYGALMDFSKHFRQGWWALLVITIGSYLIQRYPSMITGDSITADMLVFLVWIAICLAPLFKEIELPGIKLKQEVEQLKKDLVEVRNEFQSSSESHSSVSITSLAPDSLLPSIESRVESAVKKALGPLPKSVDDDSLTQLQVPSDSTFLFETRYSLEQALRRADRLLDSDEPGAMRSRLPGHRIAHNLVRHEILSSDLANAIREIYSICSAAIDGEDISQAKVEFVRRTADEVIAALNAIAARGGT